jgi:putative hydrolase of the HAD superfamily
MKDAILFDLGNTLVQYYERQEFPALLEQAIREVQSYLQKQGLLTVPADLMWQRVAEENHESADHRVRPLEGRLARIFQLDPAHGAGVVEAICRRFTAPLFARGRPYEDAVPVLRQLRSEGIRTAIVSNAPWGSPGALWREELERLGLSRWVDVAVFCTDVGWRKPAQPIFQFALTKLGAEPRTCLFVGDDPRWDLAGPQAIGIEALLIDRHGTIAETPGTSIHNLHEVRNRLRPRPYRL